MNRHIGYLTVSLINHTGCIISEIMRVKYLKYDSYPQFPITSHPNNLSRGRYCTIPPLFPTAPHSVDQWHLTLLIATAVSDLAPSEMFAYHRIVFPFSARGWLDLDLSRGGNNKRGTITTPEERAITNNGVESIMFLALLPASCDLLYNDSGENTDCCTAVEWREALMHGG